MEIICIFSGYILIFGILFLYGVIFMFRHFTTNLLELVRQRTQWRRSMYLHFEVLFTSGRSSIISGVFFWRLSILDVFLFFGAFFIAIPTMVSFSFLRLSSKITNFCQPESCHTKNGVEFCQKSIGAFRCSLATSSYND